MRQRQKSRNWSICVSYRSDVVVVVDDVVVAVVGVVVAVVGVVVIDRRRCRRILDLDLRKTKIAILPLPDLTVKNYK